MTSQFFAQSRDLFLGNRAAVVSPLLSLISQDIGNLLITQALPRLHDCTSKLLALHRDRTLQTLHHDHGGVTGAAVSNFRTGERRISLTLRSESTCLMAYRAIGHENFFTALGRCKLCGLLSPLILAAPLFCYRHKARVQTVAAKAPGEASEIGAAEENRESIDSDQPQGKWFQSYARLLFFPLNRSVQFLHVLALAIIHSLETQRYSIGGIHYFAAGLASAGDAAGGAADFTSFNGCD